MDKKSKHQGLPFDVVYTILVNFPVKTLIRFSCVSKSWRSLISDPTFQTEHYHRHYPQDALLLITRNEFDNASCTNTLHLSTYNRSEGTHIDKFSIKLPENYRHVFPIQSCQGLVCFMDGTKKHIVLCNPSTREIIVLPPTNEPSHCVGLGYVDSRKKIKVVRLFFRYDSSGSGAENCCEVFTLGNSEWTESRCPPPQLNNTYWGAPFLHGAIHMLSGNDIADACVNGIYVFNIEREEFTKIPLPEYFYDGETYRSVVHMYLKELGGSLYLIFNFKTTLDFWILKDYDSGKWMKEYTIDLTSIKNDCMVIGDPLPFSADGTIFFNVMQGIRGLLYSYNLREKTFTQKSKENGITIFYVESFLPV